jgi:preprotein translocase subunit SecA
MVVGLLSKALRFGEGKKFKILEHKTETVNAFEEEISKLSDIQLRQKTEEFKKRISDGETLEDIMPEAFAVVREASKRVTGLRHFDVQIMGGIVLHEGKIAEMKTGEGKTLVATLPAYLNALTGKGVHLVTVNDYLAKRDSQWMGSIFQFLGLTVGLIQTEMDPISRRASYAADITYGTNNEYGFDYLRDNMVSSPEELVHRNFNYAIVDEVDSILVDEARTPLIISGPSEQSADSYQAFTKIVPRLTGGKDYEVDEKLRTVAVTEEGVAKVEKTLGIPNLYEDINGQLINHLNQALRAHTLFKKNVDYIVKDGEVILVDEFTGRLMVGRRYSEGLHQAIEAKEKVKIKEENQTLATITLQNYFRLYEKLAGMTGTAATEAAEFEHIYKLETVIIPTHRSMIRKDLPDLIYKTEDLKFRAVAEDIAERNRRGQPVLVGTVSIENSEKLSKTLKRRGVPHNVLNAKHHEREAEIIAQAGKAGAVTVATNMAGRGVDIILGGNPPDEGEQKKVLEEGGLHVLGTERHESRRIDNQLRGRSGRQGDPGSSQFYLSLDDDLMRLFGSSRIGSVMERLGLPDDVPINHPLISRSIETAQRQVESQNFEMRKHVLEYDDVMNKQREVIYAQRRRIVTGEDIHDYALELIEEIMRSVVSSYTNEENPYDWDLEGLFTYLNGLYPCTIKKESLDLENINKYEIEEDTVEDALKVYAEREKQIGKEMFREVERQVLLAIIDNHWKDHLYEMDYLREGIGLRAIGQRDPLVEYKNEAFTMFQTMIEGAKEEFTKYIFHVEVVPELVAREQSVYMATGHQSGKDAAFVRANGNDKIGRNDPCPCGSGKKYKKCHGK